MSRFAVEQIGDATLYLGDAREVLPTLGQMGACITDPPYGINFAHKTLGAIAGDVETPDIRWLLPFAKQHIIWGGNHFADQLPAASRWLMWLKHDPVMFAKRDHGAFDLAWTNLGGSVRAFKNIWDGSIREGVEFGTRSVHPTQKPLALMTWCVGMTTGAVCDPYMGSGSTGVAALQAGRGFVGIEIDPHHFDTACSRIAEALKQPRLFSEPAPKPEQLSLLSGAQS